MEKEKVNNKSDETKVNLISLFKDELKRKLVGEVYGYLIKIPQVIFWIVAVVTTHLIIIMELILAGLFLGERTVIYKELLLGFGIAVLIGFLVGKIYQNRVSNRVHSQIAEILKIRKSKEEAI